MSRTGWIVVLLFVTAFVVFRASPRGQLYDSRYTLLVSHQLISQGDPRLDAFVPVLGGVDEEGRPRDYRIVVRDGAYHWFYPLGTPLLAAPFVAVADGLGRGPVDPTGAYDRGAERRLQRWLAAGAMALAGVLIFATARTWLPPGRSALVAAITLFGTPVWSTASRSLWSQTAVVLLASGAILLLARGAGRRTSLHPIALATLLSWAWMCRPTAALPALAVAVWVALRHRDSLPALVATGAAWLCAFVTLHQLAYGSFLPPYSDLGSHAFRIIPAALLGNWVSPARGLIVYCPVVLVVFAWTVRYRNTLPDPSLAGLAIAVTGLHWLLISFHAPWWGGYGYGPRLMTDTIPWLALLGTLGWAGARSEAPALRRAHAAAVGLAVAVSIVMNGVGAISRSAADWNHRQGRPDFEAELWRLDDPPFLAPLGRSRSAP